MVKAIFLDVDGVLNTNYTQETVYGFTFVADSKLELLKQLIDLTGAKVVLSSTWREGWADMDAGQDTRDVRLFVALRDKLKEYGIDLLGYTPVTDRGMQNRGAEIDMWLKDWKGEPIESMVILDDLDGRYLRPWSRKLVRTSMVTGLIQKHVDAAVKILELPLNNKLLDKAEDEDFVWYKPVNWISEMCQRIEETLDEEGVENNDKCYHCERKLQVAEKVTMLYTENGDEYALCCDCAERHCKKA